MCVSNKHLGSAQPNVLPKPFWVGQNAKMVGQCLNADHYFCVSAYGVGTLTQVGGQKVLDEVFHTEIC